MWRKTNNSLHQCWPCLFDEWLLLHFFCSRHWQMIANLCSLFWSPSLISTSISPFSAPRLSSHALSLFCFFLFPFTYLCNLPSTFPTLPSPPRLISAFRPSICILSSGADLFSNCTEECKALGHSDRCWMPSFVPSDGRQGPDYRSNLHVPGMDATLPDTEVPSSVNLSEQLTMTSSTASSSDRSFSTFGKDGQRSQSHHSLHHHLHQQQQQYSSSTLERKEYDRGTLPYKPTFLCEYQYESSLGPYDFGLVQHRY